MNSILDRVDYIMNVISGYIWPVFLAFVIIVGLYLSFKVIFFIQRKTSEHEKLRKRNLFASASISLGAMVGTGTTIGILGSLSSLAERGQMKLEAMALWALIGAFLIIPFSYSETLCSKVLRQSPRDYISMLLSPVMSIIYAVAFLVLYVFGFVGIQFSGMNSVASIIGNTYFDNSFTMQQSLLYVILPVIVVVIIILLFKRQELFISVLTICMSTAIIVYTIFFLVFIIKTSEHVPTYLNNLIVGIRNPINMGFGIPLGMVLGIKSAINTTQIGLGTMPMSAYEFDSKPREAANISIITTIISFLISILATSYITSYGVSKGIIDLPAEPFNRLELYFETVIDITGGYGLISLSLFTLLCVFTTLLASYYFVCLLFESGENLNIFICFVLFAAAAILAIFGFDIIFQVVDFLQFVVIGIHLLALISFAHGYWYRYKH